MDKKIQKIIKRCIDYSVSLIGLIMFVPFFLILAILIKLDSKGPVLFKYIRAGKNNKPFVSYKFRSMIENATEIGLGIEIAQGDSRITKVGGFLRRWSLDEIPQLVNVLKGQMSLVGPRPALPYQVQKYSELEKRRLLVEPGITGWAQINGRNLLPWKERIKLDIWYIENFSLWLDLKILFLTPKLVVSKEGLYGQEGIVRDYE